MSWEPEITIEKEPYPDSVFVNLVTDSLIGCREYFPERTCRMVKPEWAGAKSRTKVCSECGMQFQTWQENFCPHCGCKVIK